MTWLVARPRVSKGALKVVTEPKTRQATTRRRPAHTGVAFQAAGRRHARTNEPLWAVL